MAGSLEIGRKGLRIPALAPFHLSRVEIRKYDADAKIG
jgi:hypothetical protein